MNKKSFFSLLVLLFIIIITILCFSGCNENAEAKWHQGQSAPGDDIGAVGDYYYEENSFKVWQKADDGWKFVTLLNTKLPDDTTDDKEDNNDDAIGGGTGNQPIETVQDKVYVGYLGYIYHGKKNTGIKTDISENYVYENTTHIASSEMREYFPGKFTAFNDVVALMTHYDSEKNSTFYSGMDISHVSVYTERAGAITIGVAKVRDVKTAAESGGLISVDGKKYDVSAGINNISLEYPINIHTDETLVLTGVGLYYLESVDADNARGDFSLLSGEAGQVIKRTGTKHDKLAVSVKVIENSIYTETQVDNNVKNQASSKAVFDDTLNPDNAPYAFVSNSSFKKKTITQIGIPVVSVSEINDNQTFTLYVTTYNTEKTVSETIGYSTSRAITLKLPKEQLGNDPANVKRWVYVDVSDYNIYLSNLDTLAFGKKSDTVVFGLGTANSSYKYSTKNSKWGTAHTNNYSMYFDVLAKSYTTYEKHVEKYDGTSEGGSNIDMDKLQAALKGKNLSILGDSISTYYLYTTGYISGNTVVDGIYSSAKNSTIPVKTECWFYTTRDSVKDVNKTWWMQTVNETGMHMLINNSWSGDNIYASGSRPGGIADNRCLALHADKGEDKGKTPDIIALYFGTNDRNNKVAPDVFEERYIELIDKIQTEYPNADIFAFTMQDTNIKTVTPDMVYQYNDIVEKIAEQKGLNMVYISNSNRFTKYNFLNYTIDGEHPNDEGMDLVTEAFIEALYKKYVENS